MRTPPSRWEAEPYDVAAAQRLADALGLSAPVATVLVRRGLADPDSARAFLAAGERHDPLTLPGAAQACERIRHHVARGSRIAVFGDYDVDGVCATAIMLRTLRALGAEPVWQLPSRFEEGYGLSGAAARRLAGQGAELLVTVDCAITAVDEVAAAREAGLEVIVTDHHRPGERLPDCAVVHPALGGYGTPELCASGVALKLAEALLGAEAAAAELDLAALATVCDLVPLRGENRRIVREGLVELARTRKPGLRALMAATALAPGEIDERALGFRLGPRINAAGRMQRADAALELMMTDSEERAEQIAGELDLLNLDRREAETSILFAAESAAAAQAHQGAIVVAGEGWHPGVVGIVASRLVERWRRPCVVIALDGEGGGRGSGRSAAGYDLLAGLTACAEHLGRFGGHRAAAGLDIQAADVEGFRRALAAHAGAVLAPEDLIPVERVDAVVPGGCLGLPLAEELERLRPFGLGNPQPTLLVPAARVDAVAGMGKERQHARFTLVASDGTRSRGVAFGSSPRSLTVDSPHDLALRLELNRWNGAVEPRVVMRALCPTRTGEIVALGEEGEFWERVERALDAPAAQPTRVPRPPRDRRGQGFAGVTGDLLSSGERVLVAVAHVGRRRAGLEAVVAGLAPGPLGPGKPAPGPLAVAAWSALAADPSLAAGFDHLVALDPPPGGTADPLLTRTAAGTAHMAWGRPEAEFALACWRFELDLRPALAAAYRALRAGEPAEQALRGRGAHPRSPEQCALLLTVLRELELVEYVAGAAGGPACNVLTAARTELERSAAFRACADRLAAIERALASELPAAACPPTVAAAGAL